MRAFLEKRGNLVLFLAARTRSMAMAEHFVQELYVKNRSDGTSDRGAFAGPLLYRMAAGNPVA